MEEDKIIEDVLDKYESLYSKALRYKACPPAWKSKVMKDICFEILQKGIILGVKKEADIQRGRLKEDIIDDIVIPNVPPSLKNEDSAILYKIADDCFDEGCKRGIESQASKIAELEEVNNDYVNLNAQNLKRIVELELLNDQLTDANREHNKRIAELEETNKELEGQLSLITEVCKKKNLLDAVKIGKMATRKKDKRISELKKELQDLKVFREQLADELKIIISKINCELYEKHAGIFCKDYYNDNIKEVLFRWCYNCTNKKAGLEILARLRGGE